MLPAELIDSIRHAREHPEQAVAIDLPDVPDVDWENPDDEGQAPVAPTT